MFNKLWSIIIPVFESKKELDDSRKSRFYWLTLLTSSTDAHYYYQLD